MSTAISSNTLTIRCGDDRKVLIEGADGDRFITAATDIVNACRICEQTQVLTFKENFEKLLLQFYGWLSKHKGKVERCVVTTRDAGLLFIVCTVSDELDVELQDSLTDFDIEFAESGLLEKPMVSFLAIPDSSDRAISGFTSPHVLIEYALGLET